MFRCPSRLPLPPPRRLQFSSLRRLHQVSADLLNFDAKGTLISSKVPVVLGNPDEAFVLVMPDVGRALQAGSFQSSLPPVNLEDTCKLTFFHDSRHFGFEQSPYPRLQIPRDLPRQTDANTSPATLFLSGKMHEITLDGTFDAQFAKHSTGTGKNLKDALDQLEKM